MTKNIRQPPDLLRDAKSYIMAFGGIRKAAKGLNVSPAYISLIFNGLRPVPDSMAEHLGWRLDAIWRKK